MKFQFIVNQMISLFFICVFSVSVSGQKVTWGEKEKAPQMGNHIKKFVKNDGEYTYAIRSTSTEIAYLEKFDKKLNLITSTKIDLKYEKKSRLYIDMIYHKDKATLITYFFNTKQKKSYVFAQDFDLDKNITTSNPKIIASAENDEKLYPQVAVHPSLKSSPVKIKFSNDKTKIAVVYDLVYQKKTSKRIVISVLNDDFDLLWKADKTFDFLDENSLPEDLFIDNNGDIYYSLFVKEYDDRGRKEIGGGFSLFSWQNNGKNVQEYELKLNNENIASISVIKHDEKLKVIGRYTSRDISGSTKGFYLGELNSNLNTVENIKYNKIDYSIYEEMYSKKTLKKLEDKDKDPELPDLYVNDIIINDDNTISLITECQFTTTETTYSDGKPKSSTYFVYSDIFVFNFLSNFSSNWTTRIDKSGRSGMQYLTGSYVFTKKGESLYFLYHQYKSSYNESYVDLTGKSAAFNLCIIDKNGKKKDIGLDDNQTAIRTPYLRSYVSILTSDNEFIFYVFPGFKTYFLGKVIIE